MSSVNSSNNSQKSKNITPIFMYESQKEQQKKQDLAQKMNEEKQIKQRKTELSEMVGIQEDDIDVLDRTLNLNNTSNLNMLLTDISQNDSIMHSSQVINQSRFLDDFNTNSNNNNNKGSPQKNQQNMLKSKPELKQMIEEMMTTQFSQKMLEFTYEIKQKFEEIIEEQKKENDNLKNQIVDIKIMMSGQEDRMGQLQNNQDMLGKSFIQKLSNFENFDSNIKNLEQKLEITKKDLNESFDSTLERNYEDICKKVKGIEELKKKKIFEEKNQFKVLEEEIKNIKNEIQKCEQNQSISNKDLEQNLQQNKEINQKFQDQKEEIQKIKDYIFSELNKDQQEKENKNENENQTNSTQTQINQEQFQILKNQSEEQQSQILQLQKYFDHLNIQVDKIQTQLMQNQTFNLSNDRITLVDDQYSTNNNNNENIKFNSNNNNNQNNNNPQINQTQNQNQENQIQNQQNTNSGKTKNGSVGHKKKKIFDNTGKQYDSQKNDFSQNLNQLFSTASPIENASQQRFNSFSQSSQHQQQVLQQQFSNNKSLKKSQNISYFNDSDKQKQTKRSISPQEKSSQKDINNPEYEKMNESINNLRLSNDDFKIDYYNSRLSLNESNINRDSNLFQDINNANNPEFQKDNNIQLETQNSGTKISCVIQDEIVQNNQDNLKELIQSDLDFSPSNFQKQKQQQAEININNNSSIKENDEIKNVELLDSNQKQKLHSQQMQSSKKEIKKNIQQQQQSNKKQSNTNDSNSDQEQKPQNISYITPVKQMIDMKRIEQEMNKSRHEVIITTMQLAQSNQFQNIAIDPQSIQNLQQKSQQQQQQQNKNNYNNQQNIINEQEEDEDQDQQNDNMNFITNLANNKNNNLDLDKRLSTITEEQDQGGNNTANQSPLQRQPFSFSNGNNLFQESEDQQNENNNNNEEGLQLADNLFLQKRSSTPTPLFGSFNTIAGGNIFQNFQNLSEFQQQQQPQQQFIQPIFKQQQSFGPQNNNNMTKQDNNTQSGKLLFSPQQNDNDNENQQQQQFNKGLESSEEKIYSPIKDEDLEQSQNKQNQKNDDYNNQNQINNNTSNQPQLLNLSYLSNSNSNNSSNNKQQQLDNINFKLSIPTQFSQNNFQNQNNDNDIKFEEDEQIQQYNQNQQYNNNNQQEEQQINQEQNQSQKKQQQNEKENQNQNDNQNQNQEEFDLLSEKLKIDELRKSKKMRLKNSSDVKNSQEQLQIQQEIIQEQNQEEEQKQEVNFLQYKEKHSPSPSNIDNNQVLKNQSSNYVHDNQSNFMDTMDTIKPNIIQRQEITQNEQLNSNNQEQESSSIFESSQQQEIIYSSPTKIQWQKSSSQKQNEEIQKSNKQEEIDENDFCTFGNSGNKQEIIEEQNQNSNIKNQDQKLNSLQKSLIKKQSSNQKDLTMSQISQEGQEYLRKSVRLGQAQQQDDDEEIIYQLDENGYLIDENGNFILDDEGEIIKLNEEHIEYLRESNMLEDE